jgi:hypothetical protein
MNEKPVSPKRAEAARYQKIADELTMAAVNEEAAQIKTEQAEAEQKVSQSQSGNTSAPQTAEEIQQQGGDSTGSTFLDQIFGRNGR